MENRFCISVLFFSRKTGFEVFSKKIEEMRTGLQRRAFRCNFYYELHARNAGLLLFTSRPILLQPRNNMVIMIKSMVRLVLNCKFLQVISRFYATLSAILPPNISSFSNPDLQSLFFWSLLPRSVKKRPGR